MIRSVNGRKFSASRLLTVRENKLGQYVLFQNHNLYFSEIAKLGSPWIGGEPIELTDGTILEGIVIDGYYNYQGLYVTMTPDGNYLRIYKEVIGDD